MKWQRDLKVPDEKVNVNGGSIAWAIRWAPPGP